MRNLTFRRIVVLDIGPVLGGEEARDAGDLLSEFDPFDLREDGVAADEGEDGVDS